MPSGFNRLLISILGTMNKLLAALLILAGIILAIGSFAAGSILYGFGSLIGGFLAAGTLCGFLALLMEIHAELLLIRTSSAKI
jgi:hypothetical protein